MDLLCTERVTPASASTASSTRAAAPDPVLLRRRVLENLLRAEERHSTHCSYFGSVQHEITPHMRRLVAEWMLEVCEDQNCQEEVFSLAMTYLDRFLGTCAIGKNQLQLLGTACLFLASKMREPSARGLPADVLVFYTANSITLGDLCNWELLVLSKLKWDMAAVTPHDFLALLVSRLPLSNAAQDAHSADADMIVRHAQTFIALAARDYQFCMYSASTLASASIAAALRGLGLPGHLSLLHSLTGIDQDYLQTCLEQIEEMVKQTIAERATLEHPNGEATGATGAAPAWTQPPADKTHDKAGTPTDVRDVHF